MLIDIEIAFDMNGEVHTTMFGYLLKHVVEESEAGRDIGLTCAVKIDSDIYVGLFGGTLYFCGSFACKEVGGDFVPILGDEIGFQVPGFRFHVRVYV